MTIDVLIFGPLALAASADRLRIEIPDAPRPTAAAVLRAAAQQHPSVGPLALSGGARLAVNHEFAEPDSPVAAGDEVAIIAMVSGG